MAREGGSHAAPPSLPPAAKSSKKKKKKGKGKGKGSAEKDAPDQATDQTEDIDKLLEELQIVSNEPSQDRQETADDDDVRLSPLRHLDVLQTTVLIAAQHHCALLY